MSIRHQQSVDKVFFFNTCGRFTFTATTLRFVFRKRLILHVTLVRKRDHHIFLGDQIFQVDVGAVSGDFGTTFVTELFTNQFQLFADHFHQTIGATQNTQQFRNLIQQLFVFVEQFFVLKAGQFLQTQIQNRLSLLFGQIVQTITHAELWLQPFRTRSIVARTFQHRSNVAQLPRICNQRGFRFCRRRRMTDQFDDRVDVRQRHG